MVDLITPFSTAIAYASWSTSNNFTLNSDGIAAISKTGVSKFGTRNANYDVADVAPTWSASKDAAINGYFADNAGTTSDPKLVVTYSTTPPTSIKTINGLAKASVKTINGLAIASVKSWNGLT